MNPFRNIFLLIFSIYFSFGAFSQSDTVCVSKRWIAVKNTEQNAVLFDSTTSILNTIRELAEAKKIWLYQSENNSFHDGEWYPIPLHGETQRSFGYDDYLSNKAFTIRVQSDVYWVDDYGEPIIIVDSMGFSSFRYDEPVIYRFNLSDIAEMRIREDRPFNKKNGIFEGDFRPTGISFYIKNQYETRELFWVDLDELMSKIDGDHLWQSFIQNKKYSGFQFMQVSCYDDLIRY